MRLCDACSPAATPNTSRPVGPKEWGLQIDSEQFEQCVRTLRSLAKNAEEELLRSALARLMQSVIHHESRRVAGSTRPSLAAALKSILESASSKLPPPRWDLAEPTPTAQPITVEPGLFSRPRESQAFQVTYETARKYLKSKAGGGFSDEQVDELCRCKLLKAAQAAEDDRLRAAWSPEVSVLEEHNLAELTLDHMAAAVLDLDLWSDSTDTRAIDTDWYSTLAEPVRAEFTAVRLRLQRGQEKVETIREAATKALARLPPASQARNEGGTFRHELLVGLMRLYEETTGHPAVAGHVDESNGATGGFFHFARSVFLAVDRDLKPNGFKQVIDRIRSKAKNENISFLSAR